MILSIGGALGASHPAISPSMSFIKQMEGCRGPNLAQHQHSSVNSSTRISRSRQRTRPIPGVSAPHFLHPSGGGPDGVPSSLFTFRPKAKPAKNPGGSALDPAAGREGDIRAGLIEESDLPDVSNLLVEVFEPGVVLADGEFSSLERAMIGAPLEMTNNYLKAVAYNEILYSFKSRCGERLKRGDFDRSSDALVLAVRDRSSAPSAARNSEVDGVDGGELVAVVELTIRQPDGSLPFNWPFPDPWRRPRPPEQWQPYMCNLAVAKKYRGNGYGKQLVRLCEHVAKNHWGYERLYLHVDLGSPAATGLYSSMGYKGIEKYDVPLWMRKLFGLPTIRYQVKHFRGRKGAPALAATAGGEKSRS